MAISYTKQKYKGINELRETVTVRMGTIKVAGFTPGYFFQAIADDKNGQSFVNPNFPNGIDIGEVQKLIDHYHVEL